MSNASLHTGINSGELSEGVMGVAAVSKETGLPFDEVASRALAAEEHTVNISGVTLHFDGKSEKALREVLLSKDKPTDLYTQLCTASEKVLSALWPHIVQLREVEVLGGSGHDAKCDVRMSGSNGSVALSLKYGHDAPTRRQSPEWNTMVEAYKVVGLDITFFKKDYEEAYDKFMVGGLRLSNSKGDYSPELRAATDLLHATEKRLWSQIRQRIDDVFDPALAAKGIVDMYCGKEPEIYLVEMSNGVFLWLSQEMVGGIESILTPSA